MNKAAQAKHKALRAHRSKAQREGLKDFQQAGTRAMAKKRRQPGYKPSKAQHQAGLKFAAAGRRAQRRARQGKPPLRKKLSSGLVQCCAAEALAVSLRLDGAYVSEEDMLRLYFRFAEGPEDGLDLADMLTAPGSSGLALAGRTFVACALRPASSTEYTPGMILGWDSWDGADAHAGVFWDGRVISWGELCDMPSEPDEAWAVNWEPGW